MDVLRFIYYLQGAIDDDVGPGKSAETLATPLSEPSTLSKDHGLNVMTQQDPVRLGNQQTSQRNQQADRDDNKENSIEDKEPSSLSVGQRLKRRRASEKKNLGKGELQTSLGINRQGDTAESGAGQKRKSSTSSSQDPTKKDSSRKRRHM